MILRGSPVFLLTVAWSLIARVVTLRHRSSQQTKSIWQRCGNENGAVAGNGGTTRARFGWGLNWVEATVPSGTACTIAVFGADPAPNIQKVCECNKELEMDEDDTLVDTAQLARREDVGVEWMQCALEGGDCQCASGNVRFGTGARWLSLEHGSSLAHLACNTGSFQGDPSPSTNKECWCEGKHLKQDAPAARSAIVMLSRHAPDLKTWLLYHIEYMGVDHVFIQVEDTPKFQNVWNTIPPAHQAKVTVWKSASSNKNENRPKDDYTTLQARQVRAMEQAKKEAADMGIEWLFHIDDDEMLYSPLRQKVGTVLGNLPADVEQAYIPNVEALYPDVHVKSCFTETTKLNMNRYTFVGYANGKAAIRVSDEEVHAAGPHQWRTDWNGEPMSVHLEQETFGAPLLVVHFESCPFNRWMDKYWELGNTSPEKVNAIPFPFYRESILAMQKCRGPHESRPPECSDSSLERLWSRWKTTANPKIHPQDIMPLQIPWSQLLAKGKMLEGGAQTQAAADADADN